MPKHHPHPGVTLIKPNGAHVTYRARYRDPNTGRLVKVRLDPVALPNAEERVKWAKKLSGNLAKAAMERAANPTAKAAPARKEIAVAVDDYVKAAKARGLEDVTLRGYELATSFLSDWAKADGLTYTDEIDQPKLAEFHDYMSCLRKTRHAPADVGSRAANADRHSPVSINTWLRANITMLHTWRVRGLLPLSAEAVQETLKSQDVPKDPPEFLWPAQCRQLVIAAIAHDDATFLETRRERKRGKGRTRRYDPISPFLVTTLLTGMRANEARCLRRARYVPDALDGDGKVCGEIRLTASDTKTKTGRTITLSVCPTVQALMQAWPYLGEFVFGGRSPLGRGRVEAARQRLVGIDDKRRTQPNPDSTRIRKVRPSLNFGAPEFTLQTLRSTCATYLVNAPGIFGGGSSAYRESKQLGHSVTIAERDYAGVLNLPRDARTLEQAMGIEDLMPRVLEIAAG